MKYYCGNLRPDDLSWERRAVIDRLFRESDPDSVVSREYRERLAELNQMPAVSAEASSK